MSDKPKVRFLDRNTPPHIATLVIMTGMSAMVMNVFLPALPEMAQYFGTSYDVVQLSVALYLAVSASCQLIIGPLSDNLGRRPVIMGGMAIFIVASLGCIYAPSAGVFLFFRMLQATVAVNLVLSRAVVRDMFPPERSAAMIGYVTMGMSLVPMFSPMIGGGLTNTFGWASNFWLMAIGGTLTLALVWADLGETNVSRGLSLSQQFAEYPALFRSARFWGYAAATAFSSGAFFAFLGGAPFVGSTLFDMAPAELGFWFGAPASGYLLGNFTTSQLAERVGINRMILTGSIIAALGVGVSLVLFENGYGSPINFFAPMALVGFGNGLVIPNGTSGVLSVHPHLAGTASGLASALMIGGGAALAAIAGALLGPGTGAFPLLFLMLLVCLLGVAAILSVMHREKRLGIA